MNRRSFVGLLGIAGAVAVGAPEVLAIPESEVKSRKNTLLWPISESSSEIRVQPSYELGDVLYLEGGGKVEFMKITRETWSTWGEVSFCYSVIRDLDGSGAKAWPAGTVVVNTGHAGNGFIDLYKR